MKVSGQNIRIVNLLILTIALSLPAHSQTFENGFYRLTNKWIGDGKSLDVINDGTNNKLQLAESKGVTGQWWKLTPVGNGYYRLTTQWLGTDRSLDVVNDGINNKLQLAASGNASGQFWKVTAAGGGYFRLTTKWLGDERSLDVVNDGQRNKIQLAETAEVTGQYWKIEPASGGSGTIESSIRPISEFKRLSYHGFTVNVNPDLIGKPESREALDLLSDELLQMTRLLTTAQLGRLRNVPVWVQYKLVKNGALWYHRSKGWLVENGYPPELEKSVEISNIKNFFDERNTQPYAVLHEFAHAYHDLYLSEMESKIMDAYKAAVKSGKYEKVRHLNGGIVRHYALTNEIEYFAELTEAYFGKNDFYPFTRKDLEEFDPIGFEMVREAWK